MSEMTAADVGADAVGEIFHTGVKGMHWGVRKGDHPGASRRTNKEAAADAKDHARAKMFYGEGAGTRRKLLKAKIEAKAKKDPTYKAAFDHHLAKQDLGKHAEKARKERRRKDVKKSTTKTARGVHRELSGGFGNVSLASKILATGVRVATHGDDDSNSMTASEVGANAVGEMFHYGKKGMKWGVTTVDKASKPTLTREKDTKILQTKDVVVSQRRGGTYVKSKGGQRQKASDDAVKAQAARQKAKKSTTDALTNDELKAANERMQLEQNFHKLNAKTKRRGESFIAKLFASPDVRSTTADLAKKVAAASV